MVVNIVAPPPPFDPLVDLLLVLHLVVDFSQVVGARHVIRLVQGVVPVLERDSTVIVIVIVLLR